MRWVLVVAMAMSGCASDPSILESCETCDEGGSEPSLHGSLVADDGSPLAFTSIDLFGPRRVFLSTDRDGSFELESMPAGYYTLRVRQFDCRREYRIVMGDDTIVLDPITVDCGLGAPYADEPTEPPYTLSATVRVCGESSGGFAADLLGARTVVAAVHTDGTVTFDDLTPGLYTLRIRSAYKRAEYDFVVTETDVAIDIDFNEDC